MSMGKQETTGKLVRKYYDIIIGTNSLNFGALYDLRAEYYNAGIYGWNWDLYDVSDEWGSGAKRIGIIAGYRVAKRICDYWISGSIIDTLVAKYRKILLACKTNDERRIILKEITKELVKMIDKGGE